VAASQPGPLPRPAVPPTVDGRRGPSLLLSHASMRLRMRVYTWDPSYFLVEARNTHRNTHARGTCVGSRPIPYRSRFGACVYRCVLSVSTRGKKCHCTTTLTMRLCQSTDDGVLRFYSTTLLLHDYTRHEARVNANENVRGG